MITDKTTLRRSLKERRANMEENVRKISDEKIYNNLVKLAEERQPGIILSFVSAGTEPDTRRFIETMLSRGRIVAVPVCKGSDMDFLVTDSLSGLVRSKFGIDEPAGGENVRSVPGYPENSLCITPGLSFDKEGYRIGYGGGYYDRFLSDYGGFSVGICYGCLIGDIPRDSFDVRTNAVITETGFLQDF